MNQVYSKENFIVVPVGNNFLVINKKKIFEEGHTHVHEFNIAKLLISLAISKELPRNLYFVDNLIRISTDSNYIEALKEFKEDSERVDFKRMMEDVPVCKRVHGAIKRIR